MDDPGTWGVLLLAAFFGGGLNAVAGGGSFFTLPALVYAGYPALVANASGTLALLPGYMASTWGFREDLRAPRGVGMGALLLASLAGGGLGALLLLWTSEEAFRALVPWLLLAATALFAAGPWLLRHIRRQGEASGAAQLLSLFAICVYGGYFNGGVGIVLLAGLSLLGHQDLNRMNGLKNLLSTVLTAIAVSFYALGGVIAWGPALGMMLAAVAGGYVFARLARRLPALAVRTVVVLTGVVMTLLFFFG
ncbi:sulfite exporter TauE/SafE family protein [Alkalilimnicola sp. S0819]|nr:sulfite exporter TauE/SafE family protein [Alkalilimnicola sp. S0819]MPQ16109.1 TSUP family transporter [Alkalilimnicola sp. S0819]